MLIKKTINLFRPIYWPLVKLYFRFFNNETRGVRVILKNNNEILFVKTSYGLKFNFPGGNLAKDEDAEAGARREVKEELGIEIGRLEFLGTIVPPIEFEYRKNTISIFTAEVPNRDISINNLEISEVKWSPISSPPTMGPVATQIFEYYRQRVVK